MQNERNVTCLMEELTAIGVVGDSAGAQEAGRWYAERLAARGVLSLKALTDAEAADLGAMGGSTLPDTPTQIAHCVRIGLERIADGQGAIASPTPPSNL